MAMEWPAEFIDAVNKAVEQALTCPIRDVISSLDAIEKRFSGHELFSGDQASLAASIVRNKILAATLSSDSEVATLIGELINLIESSRLFSDGEVLELKRAAEGKLKRI